MLTPDYYYESVFLIPYNELWEKNIRGLIYDLDNTLTAFDEKLPPAKIVALLNRLEKTGFQICLLTNNTQKRLNGFNENLNIKGIANGLKPFARGVRGAMKIMGTSRSETVIIGDQLLSDVWAGKNAGITTILVKPITERDFLFVRVKRVLERFMLRKYFQEINRVK
jgi:HAD superfamily phosphatase (TIGR01668 family)